MEPLDEQESRMTARVLLRTQREARGWSVAMLGAQARLQEKYVAAFENGSAFALPRAYELGMLRALEHALDLAQGTLDPLVQEARAHDVLPPQPPARGAFVVVPRVIGSVIVLAVTLLGLGILAYHIWHIVVPPFLRVDAPDAQVTVDAPTVLVRGQTERGVLVRLNGELIGLTPDGSFAEEVHLHRGVNLIKITAKKAHSDDRVLYRRVLWNGSEAHTVPDTAASSSLRSD